MDEEDDMKRNKAVLLLGLMGAGFLAASLLFMVRGRGFTIRGVSNPPPLLFLFVGVAASMAAYVWWEGGPARKYKVANLTLMSVSVLFTGLAVEAGLRFFLQRTQGFNSVQQLFNPNPVGNLPTKSAHPLLTITRLSADQGLIYELQPNVDMEFGHKRLRTNAAGFRADRDVPTRKPEGALRIVGVGDSGMWGWNLEQGQGYMEVMERHLNRQASGEVSVEALNLAVPGYNTFQELCMLREKGLAYDPDVVVIGWCENDFQLPFFMYSRRDHWKEPGSYFLSLLLDRRSFLKKVMPEVLKLGDMPEGMVDPAVIEHAGEEGVRKSLRAFLSLAETHGFRVVLFGPLGKNILTLCEEVGMDTLNTYELRSTDPPGDCHVFFMHPRPCGHEILGEFLAENLLERGWVGAPGSITSPKTLAAE